MIPCTNNNKGASVKASANNKEKVMSKLKIYPKFCDTCSKGICEGYTAYDETVKLCQSCFDKDDEWQKDFMACALSSRCGWKSARFIRSIWR